MRLSAYLAGIGLAGALSLLASAQEPKSANSEKVVPSTFRAYLVTDGRFMVKQPDGSLKPGPDNRQGKIHCLVCEYGIAPVVAIFVRSDVAMLKPDGGFAKLIRGVDGLIPKFRGEKLTGFVMFLRLEGGTKVVTVKSKLPDGTETETKVEQDLEYPDDPKRDVYVKEIRDFANAVNTPNIPFGLAAERSKALTAWGVSQTDEVTVVVYNRLRIVGQPWAFAKASELTEEKIAAILASVEAAATAKR